MADHAVGKLNVSAEMPGEAEARMLRERVEAFWRDTAPDLMSRIFDEHVPSDRHIRLDRLTLDLGTIPATGFEAAAARALEQALRDALPDAIATSSTSRDTAGATLELVEAFLRTGTVPFWARGMPFDLSAALARLVANRPDALLPTLRRIAGNRTALERLVLRLSDQDLRRLLEFLAPADAALVLAYLADIGAAHRVEPLVPLAEPALHREMWVVTFEYLLRDAGTQFNRRSFLAALLQDLAIREDLSYADLLMLLRDALARTAGRLTLQSSLPATLLELLTEENLPATPREHDHGAAPPGEARQAAFIATILAWHRHTYLLPISNGALDRLLAEYARGARDTDLDKFVSGALRPLVDGASMADISASISAHTKDERLREALIRSSEDTHPRIAAPSPDNREFDTAIREGDRAKLATLIARLPHPALAALVRRIAGERTMLFRLVGLLEDETLRLLLSVLDAEHADDVSEYLATLRAAHRESPLIPVSHERFAQLTWTLAIDYAAHEPGSQFNRRSMLLSLIEGIARHDGLDASQVMASLARGLDALAARRIPTGSMPAILAELLAGRPHEGRPHGLLERAANYLRSGQTENAGPSLPELLRIDPGGLAALLRELSIAKSGQWPVQLERLLQWLSPPEIAKLLAPSLDQALLARAADATTWPEVLTRLALGEALEENPADREAILADWLERGTLPEGSPIAFADLRDALEALPAAGVRRLIFATHAARRVVLLRRLVTLFDAQGARRFLLRIAGIPDLPEDGASALALDELLRRAAGVPAIFPMPLPKNAWHDDPYDSAYRWLDGTGPAPEQLDEILLELVNRNDARLREALIARWRDPSARTREQHLILRRIADAVGESAARDIFIWLIPTDRRGETEKTLKRRRAQMDNLIEITTAALLGAAQDPESDSTALAHPVAAMGDAELRAMIGQTWRDRAARRRLIATLPDRTLIRILRILAPVQASLLLTMMQMLSANRRAMPWTALFDALAAHGPSDLRKLADGLIAAVAGDASERRILRDRALRVARENGAIEIAAAFQPRPTQRAPVSRQSANESDQPPETLYVNNAGLVIVSPFLPRLFEKLDVLRDGPDGKPRISGIEHASRAVHLLQYLVDGRCDAPEPELVLNKLLCGLDLALPVEPGVEPTAEEREVCDGLIQAVIANWPIIKNTSPAGLRETFLQREGRVTRSGTDWQLRVQRKTVDVLVDQVPWSFSVVLHRWMEHPIHVTW
ncbi:MAG: hypothetical protein JSR60_19275 [Proteobacteria bacterium]|nr:hypothetical protein [Pseudomonadota bacterium]